MAKGHFSNNCFVERIFNKNYLLRKCKDFLHQPNNVFYSYQIRFLEFHSCELALQLVISEFIYVFNKQGVGNCVEFILKIFGNHKSRNFNKDSKWVFSGMKNQ